MPTCALTFAGAFPSAKGEGFEQGADWPEQRRGFRGNAENAKTKLCMRCALSQIPAGLSCEGLAIIFQTSALAQVEKWSLPFRR